MVCSFLFIGGLAREKLFFPFIIFFLPLSTFSCLHVFLLNALMFPVQRPSTNEWHIVHKVSMSWEAWFEPAHVIEKRTTLHFSAVWTVILLWGYKTLWLFYLMSVTWLLVKALGTSKPWSHEGIETASMTGEQDFLDSFNTLISRVLAHCVLTMCSS